MTQEDRIKWDDRYEADPQWQRDRRPFPWLVEHAPRSEGGLALDLACGLGQNAVYLAQQGYQVVAVDGSRVGLSRGQISARKQGQAGRILFVQADLDAFRPTPACCDLLCVIRFLSRDLFPWLVSALRPGGVLIYATLNWRWGEIHPEVNPDFLLRPGELPGVFPGLSLLDHREDDDMSYAAFFKAPAR
jgi:SAM-dependent methyltransferase